MTDPREFQGHISPLSGDWTAPPPGFELLQPPPPAKGRGKLLAASAAALALVGGVATYTAVSSSSASGGAASPQKAISGMFDKLDKSDFAGALNALAPNERDAITRPLLSTFDSLKRNDVLRPNADLSHVAGVTFRAKGLKFAAKTLTVNDHVRIVELTGGTITVSADAAKLPLTADLLKAVHAPAASRGTTSTVDIGQEVEKSGKPIRLAAQRSGNGWFPSLLYTIADNAATSAGLTAPSPADRVPDLGAASADGAVRSIVTDLFQGDVRSALALTSPDELGVLHDYGKLIIERAGYPPAPVQVKGLRFSDSQTSGVTRVTLTALDLTVQGQDVAVTQNGSCFTVRAAGRTQKTCLTDALAQAEKQAVSGGMTTAERNAFTDLLSGVGKLGIDVTKTRGRYYVNPVRTYAGLLDQVLSGLKGDDAHLLLNLIARAS